jgi:hypothetical protein
LFGVPRKRCWKNGVAEYWRNGVGLRKDFESQEKPLKTLLNGASVENISYDIPRYSNHPTLHYSI